MVWSAFWSAIGSTENVMVRAPGRNGSAGRCSHYQVGKSMSLNIDQKKTVVG